MLRLTLERVGADGQAKPIGTAVIGRWGGRHVAGLVDDRHPPQVGAVDDHDPDDGGPWALVRDALASCLDSDVELASSSWPLWCGRCREGRWRGEAGGA